ncbi:winged helix DNA-binding domain-containing protein [Nonomuraea sp. NBC_00507]
MHARVAGVTSEEIAQAIEADKTLLQTWCMRGAPFLFPTQDAPVSRACTGGSGVRLASPARCWRTEGWWRRGGASGCRVRFTGT